MSTDPANTTRDPTRRMARRMARGAARLALWGIILASLAGISGYLWFQAEILPGLPTDLYELREWRPITSCQVFAADQSKVDEFYIERRIWVPIGELPPQVWRSFVAAEDRRFMEHKGVDWQGVARAFWVNLRAGSIAQGGSTITQQLVKNLLVGNERSYVRKLREAVLALRLERELTKQEVLELYINYVYLGAGNYGVEAAARDYFGVSARDLDTGQAALLAGLVPAPSRYSPRNHPELAQQRRELVLHNLVLEGYLTRAQADGFADDPVLVPRPQVPGGAPNAAYDTVVRRAIRHMFGQRKPFEAGLVIHTALQPDIQAEAVAAVQQAVEAVDERQGRPGAVRHLGRAQRADFLAQAAGLSHDGADGQALFPDPGSCFAALVGPSGALDDLRAAGWRFAMDPDQAQIHVRSALPDHPAGPLSQHVRAGDILRVCLLGSTSSASPPAADTGVAGTVTLSPRPWAEGAAVVLENATGQVLALVGGYDATLEGYVRAVQAQRQPGSSFKPYVYATALLQGRGQLDTVVDGPLSLPAGNGGTWRPRNYGGSYAGSLPMRRALARSLNTVAVRLIMETGPEAVVHTAHAMGVTTALRQDLTIALGSSEVTPLDQATGYATIARLGVPTAPIFIQRLLDAEGRELGQAGGPVIMDGQPVAHLPGGPGERALPAGVAYELADMLREVVRAGTARRAGKEGYDRAGKTGTTNGFQDAWFVGFSPRYTVAVWIGTDGTTSLGPRETGGRTALPAWTRIMDYLPQPAGERLPLPDDVILIPSGGQWVALRRGHVPPSLLGYQPLGDAPLPMLDAQPKEKTAQVTPAE